MLFGSSCLVIITCVNAKSFAVALREKEEEIKLHRCACLHSSDLHDDAAAAAAFLVLVVGNIGDPLGGLGLLAELALRLSCSLGSLRSHGGSLARERALWCLHV